MFERRAAIGYDHGYDAEVFYLGLALDSEYMEGFVEGCLERIGEDYLARLQQLGLIPSPGQPEEASPR